MTFIPAPDYGRILTSLPILCVDVIIENCRGEFLLLKRANEPRIGAWWVVGGRVLKGETLEEAALRKAREETGLGAEELVPVGYYEATYGRHPLVGSADYHAVSVVFRAMVRSFDGIVLDSQSRAWKAAESLPEEFVVRRFLPSAGSETAGERT